MLCHRTVMPVQRTILPVPCHWTVRTQTMTNDIIFSFLSWILAMVQSKKEIGNFCVGKYEKWLKNKQVTRGHNTVADRWAGAANPLSTPNTLSNTDTYTKSFKMLVFPLFDSCSPTDRRTDRPTDGRTDKASYRVARPRLKTILKTNIIFLVQLLRS